ncbi:putative plastidic glucose transporter 2 [Cinnamomum micranthum f. kanehirae]|uniref:Putative plastidic glucose transporter 2 n=1 Tax=Cinnamomum micranthum f. kanehirae TaxID=337451 RepID=A0A3S3MBM3_9MAGN|nr:putative plastidic glucose transporter 2 [Cinnamomum micranthum f. kanehirae]
MTQKVYGFLIFCMVAISKLFLLDQYYLHYNSWVPSDVANICVGFANLSGSVIAMFLMDKAGRRGLLLGSFLGMAIAMGLQVTAASLPKIGSGSLYMSVGGMLMFVLMFALGAGPVPGLLLPEIFPSRIRAKAMAICMCVHWVVNFFVGLLFLRLLEKLGPPVLKLRFHFSHQKNRALV